MSWLQLSLSEEEFSESGSAEISRTIDSYLDNHSELSNTFFAVKEHKYGKGYFYYFFNAPPGIILDHLIELGAKECKEPPGNLEKYRGSEELYKKYYQSPI